MPVKMPKEWQDKMLAAIKGEGTDKPSYITVAKRGHSWAAILMGWVADKQIYDVFFTADGCYTDIQCARMEAQAWANGEQLEYRE